MKSGIELQKLGKRVSRVRCSRHMSAKQLSRQIGIEKGSLSNIETGNSSPSSELLFDIADALGVPADYLVADSLRNKSVAVDYMMYDMLVCAPQQKRERMIAMIKAISGIVAADKIESRL